MDAHIVIRVVAGAAADFVYQHARAYFYANSCAEAIAVGSCAYRFNCDPVIICADAVDQQAWCGVHVAYYRGELAVVPEVADG